MADRPDKTTATTGTRTETVPGRLARIRRPAPGGAAAARRRTVSLLAGVVSAITTIIVLILAVHIVFVAFEANTGNALVGRIADWADGLAWQFKDVFEPADAKVRVAVNYGLAAVVYLVIGRLLVGLIRRLA
ncbi:hypothetical protein [Actinomadura macrotermitis]|uniref:Uncharacterized protein n=1 Tax=Actinomadura macrotermitis TaxID=2585200 RepID=A0A7K0C8P3_9ACTN|nr:hypothetical protein [Actinomadura macrotermitis]MQY09841.1 hypothetical protein [Actinomadura macrotermitis]